MAEKITAIVTVQFPVWISTGNYGENVTTPEEAVAAEHEMLNEADEYLMDALGYAIENFNDSVSVSLADVEINHG